MDWLKRRGERKEAEREERDKLQAAQQAAHDAANRIREAAERAYKEEIVEDLGVVAFQRSGTIRVTATNTAEKKLAIRELRLKKKELTAQKRELTAEIAAIRAEYREKVAGQYSTAALPRGTAGRALRADIQANRRSEKVEVDKAIMPIERKRNAIDNRMITIDRTIARLYVSDT